MLSDKQIADHDAKWCERGRKKRGKFRRLRRTKIFVSKPLIPNRMCSGIFLSKGWISLGSGGMVFMVLLCGDDMLDCRELVPGAPPPEIVTGRIE